MAYPTVCMSSPIFLMRLRFFWISPTTRLQPASPSSGSSSSSSSLITNWGFVQNESVGRKQKITKTQWCCGGCPTCLYKPVHTALYSWWPVFLSDRITYWDSSCSLQRWILSSSCHQTWTEPTWRQNRHSGHQALGYRSPAGSNVAGIQRKTSLKTGQRVHLTQRTWRWRSDSSETKRRSSFTRTLHPRSDDSGALCRRRWCTSTLMSCWSRKHRSDTCHTFYSQDDV